MPRRSAGPKLWFDKERQSWTIVDGRSRHRTGCRPEDVKGAERKLRDYIEAKHRPVVSETPLLADVIAAYAVEHIQHVVSGKHIQYDLEKLTRWWGTKRITDINSTTCRAYVSARNAPGCSRREMSFLNAAISHWKTNHAPMMATPKIKLGPKPLPRQEFMTRGQAARFLKVARHTPHLARFFLVGWYTGSRRSVITGLKWSMIDLETGVMQRKERGSVQTKKRAPTIKVGDHLLAHLRRWHKMDGETATYIVHFRKRKINRPISSWDRIRRSAGLPDYITPHILRHSRATHMLAAGIPLWETAQYLGMSPAVLEKHYGHFSPDWQKDAANVR